MSVISHFNQGSSAVVRRMLLRWMAAATVLALEGCAHRDAGTPRTVLFVCQYGTVKSAIAREVLRTGAMQGRVPVNVMSRGITPEDHASAALRQRLRADGIDPDRDPLTQLDADTLRAADIVVLFDDLPMSFSRPDARDWTDTPSMNADYDRARAVLDARIALLLTELGQDR